MGWWVSRLSSFLSNQKISSQLEAWLNYRRPPEIIGGIVLWLFLYRDRVAPIHGTWNFTSWLNASCPASADTTHSILRHISNSLSISWTFHPSGRTQSRNFLMQTALFRQPHSIFRTIHFLLPELFTVQVRMQSMNSLNVKWWLYECKLHYSGIHTLSSELYTFNNLSFSRRAWSAGIP